MGLLIDTPATDPIRAEIDKVLDSTDADLLHNMIKIPVERYNQNNWSMVYFFYDRLYNKMFNMVDLAKYGTMRPAFKAAYELICLNAITSDFSQAGFRAYLFIKYCRVRRDIMRQVADGKITTNAQLEKMARDAAAELRVTVGRVFKRSKGCGGIADGKNHLNDRVRDLVRVAMLWAAGLGLRGGQILKDGIDTTVKFLEIAFTAEETRENLVTLAKRFRYNCTNHSVLVEEENKINACIPMSDDPNGTNEFEKKDGEPLGDLEFSEDQKNSFIALAAYEAQKCAKTGGEEEKVPEDVPLPDIQDKNTKTTLRTAIQTVMTGSGVVAEIQRVCEGKKDVIEGAEQDEKTARENVQVIENVNGENVKVSLTTPFLVAKAVGKFKDLLSAVSCQESDSSSLCWDSTESSSSSFE